MAANVRFVCQERVNPKKFPELGCEVRVLPQLLKRPLPEFVQKLESWWYLAINSNTYYRFTGSSNEIDWWKRELQRTGSKISLIHYGTTAVGYARMLSQLEQPFAIHFNGFDLSMMTRSARYRKKIVEAAKLARGLIVVADYMRDWLTGQGISAAKIHKVPYGVPDEFLSHDVRANHSSDCVFLMVGRLTPKKAPLLTIKAFAKCHQKKSLCEIADHR